MSMGPGIIIPIIVLVVVVPVGFWWARNALRNGGGGAPQDVPPPSARLTSNALRGLPSPSWRVVHEIAPDKLGGLDHVILGPAGVFGVETSMEPLPPPPSGDADARAVGAAAIARGPLDDALRRCAMASDALVRVHWGAGVTHGPSVDVLPGVIAVDGRSFNDWANGMPTKLSQAQVDLAWQAVATAIGRPDPLA